MTLQKRASQLLRAAADGKPLSRDEAHALAREWLELTGGHVALAVLEGGDFEVAKIIELCGLVLEASAVLDGQAVDDRGGRR